MRKTGVFILFLALLAQQYARHINFLQCLTSNSSSPSSVRCDCVKVFAEADKRAANPESFPQHQHVFMEDIYDSSGESWELEPFLIISPAHFISPHSLLPAGITREDEYPPESTQV